MATVLRVEGAVSITSNGQSFAPQAAGSGSRLRPGDQIETGAAASIDFVAVPGTLVRLDGDSRLVIERLSLTKDGNRMVEAMQSRDVRFRLLRGNLSVAVEDTGRNAQVRIVTPTGHVLAHSGCTFALRITEKKTRALCVRGSVIFQSEEAAAGVPVEAGFFLEWPPSSAPRIAAESDAQTQAEVAQLLEVERNLLSLEQRERAQPVPGRTE